MPLGAAYPRALHDGSVEGLYFHGADRGSDISLKREKMMKQKKKGFINLLESVPFICKGKLIPLIPTNFLFLLSHFFPLNAWQ